MLIDMCLLKLVIYQDTIAPNVFEIHANSSCPDFFSKVVSFVQFDITSDVTSFYQTICLGLKVYTYSGLSCRLIVYRLQRY